MQTAPDSCPVQPRCVRTSSHLGDSALEMLETRESCVFCQLNCKRPVYRNDGESEVHSTVHCEIASVLMPRRFMPHGRGRSGVG